MLQITAEQVGQSIAHERLTAAFETMLQTLPRTIREQATVGDAIWLAGLLRFVGEQFLELELASLSQADALNDLACCRSANGRPA